MIAVNRPALLCVLLAAGGAGLADPPKPAPKEEKKDDDSKLKGKWEVIYEDAVLGRVEGYAHIAKDEKSVRVVLSPPRSKVRYELKSKEFTRTGNDLKIVLEGKSPPSKRIESEDLRKLPRLGVVEGAKEDRKSVV